MVLTSKRFFQLFSLKYKISVLIGVFVATCFLMTLFLFQYFRPEMRKSCSGKKKNKCSCHFGWLVQQNNRHSIMKIVEQFMYAIMKAFSIKVANVALKALNV